MKIRVRTSGQQKQSQQPQTPQHKVRSKRRGRRKPTHAPAVSQLVDINDVASRLLGNSSVSRIRKYLPEHEGREWNPESPHTPEGRLSRYNPEDWHAPSKDEQGHHDTLTIEFHPAVIDELTAYCNSGRLPISRSPKQAIRVAVVELLHVLRRLEPLPESHMSIIETACYLNAHAEVMCGYQEEFNGIRERAYRLMHMGAHNEARKLVHDGIKLAKSIQSTELREKFTRELEREFRNLLKSGRNKVRTNVRKNKKLRRGIERHAADSTIPV